MIPANGRKNEYHRRVSPIVRIGGRSKEIHMNDKKNLMFEELESVEELGAFYDFLDGVGKGLAIGTGVVAIVAVVT